MTTTPNYDRPRLTAGQSSQECRDAGVVCSIDPHTARCTACGMIEDQGGATVIASRSYLVRREQTFIGVLPPDWEDMNFPSQDQYICDNLTLTEESIDTVNNDQLDFTVSVVVDTVERYSQERRDEITKLVPLSEVARGDEIVFRDEEGTERVGFVEDTNPETNEVTIDTGDGPVEDPDRGPITVGPTTHVVGDQTVGVIAATTAEKAL